MGQDQVGETVTLWCAVGAADFGRIEADEWRSVPEGAHLQVFTDRAEAVRVAREKIVAAEGVAHVLRLQVREAFFAEGSTVGAAAPTGERSIPGAGNAAGKGAGNAAGDGAGNAAGDGVEAAALTEHLAGVIVEAADFRGPVPAGDFADGPELPEAWRAYLQSPSWIRRGWLTSGKYVWLYPPTEGRDLLKIWEAEPRFPGIALIAGDGGLENFVLDLRQTPPPVLMLSNASETWDDAILQAPDVTDFINRIEDGSFDLVWSQS
ncbi:hypothetical protein AB0J83_26695 [Actinoplanes sp. NPDC049596]|uniref:hypothetical protein n=1 Tax=unclassified Actinoplanes TaxID=2626549 RepID=UPI0034153E94